MNKLKALLSTIILLSIFFNSCANLNKLDTEYAKDRNICKELKGKALIYMVFVDTKDNNVWTEFDINTAFKSAGDAADWMMANAKKNNIQLEMEIKYFQSGKMKTVMQDLPASSVKRTLGLGGKGIGSYLLNRWADKVAAAVGKKVKFPGEVDNSIIKKPKNNVELISKLRDIYRVDNVALVYLLNNNFTNDVSVAMNTESNKNIEYAVASYKTPTELSHLILNLFGAANLHDSPFRKNQNTEGPAVFPNDIMNTTKTPLEKAEIGSLTQYLIGWKEQRDSSYQKVIVEGWKK